MAEVRDPFRFATESKFAGWCGTGAVALSSGELAGAPVRHRLDFGGNHRINNVLYIASVTQHRDIERPAATSTASSAWARPDEKHDALTNDTPPTDSSAACGTTKNDASRRHFNPRLTDRVGGDESEAISARIDALYGQAQKRRFGSEGGVTVLV